MQIIRNQTKAEENKSNVFDFFKTRERDTGILGENISELDRNPPMAPALSRESIPEVLQMLDHA